MEEISVEKIKARIKENLTKAKRYNFVVNVNEEILKTAAEPRLVVRPQSVKEKIIGSALKYKHVIKKIPIFNTVARKYYLSLIYDRAQNHTLTDKKARKLIRRIPFLGYPLWWIYMIVKAPMKIGQLLSEISEVRTKGAASDLKIGELLSEISEVRATGAASELKIWQLLSEVSEVRAAGAASEVKIGQLVSEVNEVRTRGAASEERIKQLFALSEDQKIIPPDVLITEGYIRNSRKDEVSHSNAIASKKAHNRNYADTFYYHLENVFRGSLEDIKNRQSIYLSYVTEAHSNCQGEYFLDVGCGRGEFLSLLQEHGIPAKGVDINRVTTDLARGKWGVDVILSDALEYLNGLDDNLLIGVSLFHVIEHLDFKYLENILEAACKKIALNGIIILETMNPSCPITFEKFYLDPSHNRPYPSELIEFMLAWHTFENVKIIYSIPVLDMHFKQPAMNYQNYAALGKRMRP